MSSAAEPDQWYYARQGEQLGPVPRATLREMLVAGQVMWSDAVWSAGMAARAPANTVAALRPASPAERPPPLPPQAIHYAGPPPPGQRRDIAKDPGMRMLMPVGRSPWAIAAGYLGLLSPLLIFAPFAVVVSIMAMRDIKLRNTHGMGRAIFGLIMGGIFSIGICVAIAMAIAGS